MKRFLLILSFAIGCSFLASCEKETILTLDQTSINFADNGGSQSISITANKPWTASSNQSWCKVSPSSGEDASSDRITITCDSNTAYDERSCMVIITCQELNKSIQVKQLQNNAIVILSDSYDIEDTGKIIDVEVKANVSYTVTIESSAQGWIKQVSTKDLSSSHLSFEVSPNPTYDSRIGHVTLKESSGKAEQTITINQAPLSVIIPQEIVCQVDCSEQDLNVVVSANVDFTCSICEKDKAWISFVQTKSLSTKTATFHINSNEGYATRRAIVRVIAGNIERTVVIGQAGQPIVFTDNVLFSYMINHFDKNHDYVITSDEIDGITSLNIESRQTIHSLSGIQFLPNLRHLSLKGKNDINELNISDCKALESLDCQDYQLSKLIVSGATNLRDLRCSNNQLEELRLSECINLQHLECKRNPIQELDLSNNLQLQYLDCSDCNICSLLLPKGSSSLNTIRCQNNHIPLLDLSGYHELKQVRCGNNEITSLGLLDTPFLESLSCYNNRLSCLDALSLPNLKSLVCSNNSIVFLDLSNLSRLRNLECSNCYLDEIDISACLCLEYVNCIKSIEDAVELKTIIVRKGYQCTLSIPSSTVIVENEDDGNDDNTLISSFDPVFKNYLLAAGVEANNNYPKIDRNGDGEISMAEAKCVKSISIETTSMKTLTGVEFFVNLEKISIHNSDWKEMYGELSNVDLSNNYKLQEISIIGQNVESIEIPDTPMLEEINIFHCPLRRIDVSKNGRLERLTIEYSSITSLDVSHNNRLKYLQVDNNQIEELSLGLQSNLEWLSVGNNQIDKLDVTSFPSLYSVQCSGNQIKSLDLHNNVNLTMLLCESDILEKLFLFNDYYVKISDFRCSSSTIIIVM